MMSGRLHVQSTLPKKSHKRRREHSLEPFCHGRPVRASFSPFHSVRYSEGTRRLRSADARERILSCSSATRDGVETAEVGGNGTDIKLMSATVIQLSDECRSLIHSDEETVSNGFVLLTKEPGFDLGAVNEISAGRGDMSVRLSDKQISSIEELKITPLYLLMFRLCAAVLVKSRFWKEATVLPCRISADGSWEIAWDIVDLLVDPCCCQMFDKFVRELRQSKARAPDKPLADALYEIQLCSPTEFATSSEELGWEEIEEFLAKCVVMIPDQWPCMSLSLEKTYPGIKLAGCRISPLFTTVEGMSSQLSLRSGILYSTRSGVLLPVPASWYLAFVCLQGTLPAVVPLVDVQRLKRVLGVGSEVSNSVLVEKMDIVNQENKKYATLGGFLLRLATVLNRWQTSKNMTLHNSKAESVESFQEIRNVALWERLLQNAELSEILCNWLELKFLEEGLAKARSDIDWRKALRENAVKDATPSDTFEYFLPEAGTSHTFKAFVGTCFESQDFLIVWKLCEKIGLVNIVPGGILEAYVGGWSGLSSKTRERQEWEMGHEDRWTVVRSSTYESFCEAFGFTFHEKHRFEWAMFHPSLDLRRSSLYGWLVLIGSAIVDVLFQEYITQTRPDLSHAAINGIFDGRKKKDVCFDASISLNLHRIGRIANEPAATNIVKHATNKAALRRENGTRNFITTLMHALIGAVALDVGLDVKRVMEIVIPHFSELIDACTSPLSPNYYIVDRYVPTYLEIVHFRKTDLQAEEYFPALLQLVSTESGDVVFGFYILTKKKLPPVPEEQFFDLDEGLKLQTRMRLFEEAVTIDKQHRDMLQPFQFEWFAPILPPEMKFLESGTQTKKYLVAPAKGSDTSEAAIDWDLVRHVVQKSLPDDISQLLQNYTNGQDPSNEKNLLSAESVLEKDNAFEFNRRASGEDDEVVVRALRKLLFRNDFGLVVSVVRGPHRGCVLNNQSMNDWLPPSSVVRKEKIVHFSSSMFQCLPYTMSYFKCLSLVPYLLTTVEQWLLTEDYRRRYNLPDSIPANELVTALSCTGDSRLHLFSRLEALGHSVMQYLYTLDITLTNPDKEVGRIAVMRAVRLNSRDLATKKDIQCLLGHATNARFLPYKSGQSWYPPANPPFGMESFYMEEAIKISREEKNAIASQQMVMKPIEGRLGSGRYQNVTTGVPAKHFKAIAALCFLHEGIESACTYLHRIEFIQMPSYPRPTNKPLKDKQTFKKFSNLQNILRYQFRDVETLAQAFMHSTVFGEQGENNEVLEFLGDAILDLCMCRYVYHRYPWLTIAASTELKMELTSNRLFGWLSASPPLELHQYLMHAVPEFSAGMEAVKLYGRDGLKDDAAGKIASDVFEALLGAVLVDCDYSVEGVNDVMLSLMQESLANLSKLGIEDPETKQNVQEESSATPNN